MHVKDKEREKQIGQDNRSNYKSWTHTVIGKQHKEEFLYLNMKKINLGVTSILLKSSVKLGIK